MTLRFLSYNIRYGGTGREASIAAVIRACAPDVVVLQEATDPGVVARVAQRIEFPHWGSHAGYSTGFLSRLPVEHHAWHSARGARHPFLEVVLGDPSGDRFGSALLAGGAPVQVASVNGWADVDALRSLLESGGWLKDLRRLAASRA